VSGWEEYDDEPFETVTYGERMKFAVPFEQKKRKRMKLAKGMKIIVDDSYEKFNEDEFKEHLASVLDTMTDTVGKQEEMEIPTVNDGNVALDGMTEKHHDGSDGFNSPTIIQ